MDCRAKDQPTLESNFSQVIFLDVQNIYPPKTELHCRFRRENNFVGNAKDWIAIYKVGWKTTRDYYTWTSALAGVDNTVFFKAYYLPPDDDEYYQFCYVDQNREVRGASIPFQFRHISEDEDDILIVTTEIEMMKTTEENAELKKIVEEQTAEIAALKEKVSSVQNENQAQAEKIQTLQEDLENSTEKMLRLETENMEMTVQIMNLKVEIEMKEKNIQSLDIDLQMQRSQEAKLLSEIKEMEREKDNLQEEKKHSENLQIHMKNLHEEKEKMESKLKLYREKELIFISDKEELEKSLEKVVAENRNFQSEELTKQKVVENLTYTANQCKEETVKLKAELEFQTCTLDREKKQKETLRQSLDKEIKKVFDLEQNMEQNSKKLRSAEEKMTGLFKQVEVLQADNENKMKQMGILHMTIANLEGEVKSMTNECKSKMEADRTVRELRTQLISREEAMRGMDVRMAQQQDICRQHTEENITLRSTVEIRELEIQDLKDVLKTHRIEIDDLNSRFIHRSPNTSMPPNPVLMFGNPYKANYPGNSLEFASTSSSSGRRPISPLHCPICAETFLVHECHILDDHMMCHRVQEEARP